LAKYLCFGHFFIRMSFVHIGSAIILFVVFHLMLCGVSWAAYFPQCESQLINSQFVENAIAGLVPPNPNDRLVWIPDEGLNVLPVNYTTKPDTGFQYFGFLVTNRSAERWIVVSFNANESIVNGIYLSADDCPLPQCPAETNIQVDPHDCGFGARALYNSATSNQNTQLNSTLLVVLKKSTGVFFLGVQQQSVPATFQLQIFPSQPSCALARVPSLLILFCAMFFTLFLVRVEQ
jgi:hypothetical protein